MKSTNLLQIPIKVTQVFTIKTYNTNSTLTLFAFY